MTLNPVVHCLYQHSFGTYQTLCICFLYDFDTCQTDRPKVHHRETKLWDGLNVGIWQILTELPKVASTSAER